MENKVELKYKALNESIVVNKNSMTIFRNEVVAEYNLQERRVLEQPYIKNEG